MDGKWESVSNGGIGPTREQVITGGPPPSPVPTRLQTILSSIDTINIIYDTEQARSLASRFAHDLLLYHRLDSALVEDAAGVDPSSFEGNSVIIGTLHSISIQHLLKQALTSFNLRQGGLYLSDKHLPTSNSECKSTGIPISTLT